MEKDKRGIWSRMWGREQSRTRLPPGGKRAGGGPALHCGFEFRLKQQLQGELNLPCGAEVTHGEPSAENLAERGAGYCVGRIAEVGMVENVEHLGAELQVEPLRQLGVFQKRKVPIVDAGSMEESPVGVTFLSQIIRPEGRGAEILSPRFSGIHDLHGCQ